MFLETVGLKHEMGSKTLDPFQGMLSLDDACFKSKSVRPKAKKCVVKYFVCLNPNYIPKLHTQITQ